MSEDSINPLLPRLIKGAGPANLTEAGKWAARGADELSNVSSILEVNVPNVEINSIPTVWARPLLFEMALFSEHHKIKERIVGEWRGLLALIALFEFKDLPLTVMPIDLSKESDAKNKIFYKGLSGLIPKKSLTSDTSWMHLFIILYNGKPIGLTSPTTLVATATDYAYSGIDVKWFDGKKLGNPIGNELSVQERRSLSSWLNVLRDRLDSHPTAPQNANRTIIVDDENLNSLNTQIESFISDLEEPTAFVPGAKTLGITGEKFGVFAYLNKPAGIPQDIGISAVKLIPSPSRPLAAADLLVVDNKIWKDWTVTATEVTVYKTKTLNDLGINGHKDGKHNQFAGTDLEGAEVWNAKELFSSKLLLIRNKANAFPGTIIQNWLGNLPKHNNQPTSIVLPINKKLLEYFTPEDLNSRVTLTQTPNNEIKVGLRLTLSGINDNHEDFTAEKIYSLHQTEDFEILDSLPILEVFPNFRRTDWKANYITFSADNLSATFDVEPFKRAAENSTINIGRNGRRTIWRTEDYPEALVCKRKGEETGILLLNEVEEASNQNKNYQVGVDFGASGTCLYAAEGSSHPICIEFKNQKLSVTNKEPEQASELFDFFLPDINIKSPFLSLFHPFHNEEKNKNKEDKETTNEEKKAEDDLKPILEGHVYYFEDKLATGIIPNLKWSDDPRHRQYVKSFLTQLCIQTAAELVKDGAASIEWNFSYPTAFFKGQAHQYKDIIWVKVIKNVNKLCGLQSPDAKHFSESLASARYFREEEKAKTALGTIFIDIGSSTSDISVWQEDKPLWQTSLRYAGRDVFLNYLISKPQILERLLGKDKIKELNDAIEKNEPEEKKWAVTDVILRKNKEGIFTSSLGNHSGTPEIKELTRYLAFGLGGLFFYLGLGVKSLIDSKKYTLEMPKIYAGGNGALMFRWLTNGGKIEENNTIQEFFKEIFTKALSTENVTGNFSLQMSKNPKHEASHGLVRTDERNDATDTVEGVVAGESFLLDGELKGPETMLDDKMFGQGITVPDRLKNLEKYIEVFNEAALETTIIQKISIGDKLSNVRGSLANTLGDLRDEKTKKIIVEPIFMIALKHLMEEIR
ncbi:MAG: hypothetical protein ACKVQW_07335 [Pyrinomonadaceae bacterium]